VCATAAFLNFAVERLSVAAIDDSRRKFFGKLHKIRISGRTFDLLDILANAVGACAGFLTGLILEKVVEQLKSRPSLQA
jgi:hypothetical protein